MKAVASAQNANPTAAQIMEPTLQPMKRSMGRTTSSGLGGGGSGSRPRRHRPQRKADQASRNPARVPRSAEVRKDATPSTDRGPDGQYRAPAHANKSSAGGARRSNSRRTYSQLFQVSVNLRSSSISSGFIRASGGRTGPPAIPSIIIISFMTVTS
jgi:hypothetical protein